MVDAALARGGVAAAAVVARAHAALDGLHDRLVLVFDAVERRARAGVELRRVALRSCGSSRGAVEGERLHEVHR
jgi:hypothetical protein